MEAAALNPRGVKLITRIERKKDRTDVELVARLGRVEAQLLSPVTQRSVEHQAELCEGTPHLRARWTASFAHCPGLEAAGDPVHSEGARTSDSPLQRKEP